MDSVAVSEAVDPGSTPGACTILRPVGFGWHGQFEGGDELMLRFNEANILRAVIRGTWLTDPTDSSRPIQDGP